MGGDLLKSSQCILEFQGIGVKGGKSFCCPNDLLDLMQV
jgi:hypothetical protein